MLIENFAVLSSMNNIYIKRYNFRLVDEVETRNKKLEESERAQQYFFDADEAIAWMGEQELYMMASDKAKVS